MILSTDQRKLLRKLRVKLKQQFDVAFNKSRLKYNNPTEGAFYTGVVAGISSALVTLDDELENK